MSGGNKNEVGSMNLHYPKLHHFILWAIHLREMGPEDIGDPGVIFRLNPGMRGDPDLGIGNEGNCQDYCGDWNWWWKFLFQHGVYF